MKIFWDGQMRLLYVEASLQSIELEFFDISMTKWNECCTGNIYYYVVAWTIISPQRGEHSCCQQPKYRSLFQRHISHLAFIKFVLKIYQNPEKKSIAVECYKFHHDQINYQNYFVSNQIFKVHCLAIDYANKTAAIFYLHMRRYCNANPLD